MINDQYTVTVDLTESPTGLQAQTATLNVIDAVTTTGFLAGPATNLSVGSVTSGTTAGVTLTGIAPNQQLNFVLPASAANDATTTSKGSIQLAGDLAGTAASPLVVFAHFTVAGFTMVSQNGTTRAVTLDNDGSLRTTVTSGGGGTPGVYAATYGATY